MKNDAFLVQQTLSGNHEAFHTLIKSYQTDIYALALSYVKNIDDAKEIVQEVFLEAYRDLSSLKQPEKFYFWLRQIAKHHCQSYLERRREFVPLSEDIAVRTPSIDDKLILRETLAKIMQAIDELPETEKRLIKERYLEGSGYDELQARYGLSYNALGMRLLRAKQKVRTKIEKLLAGMGILSWQDVLKKMLLGGIEVMKISLKVKIITIGIAGMLVLGGAGIVMRYYQEPKMETQNPAITEQTNKEKNTTSFSYEKRNNSKLLSEEKKPKQIENFISYLDSLEKKTNDDLSIAKSEEKMEKAVKTEEFQKLIRVKDFPEFDLSTPESAWATIMRIITQGSRGNWGLVSLNKDHEESMQVTDDMSAEFDMSEEQIENYLNAEIVEVYISEDRAGVISRIPNQTKPIDIRYLAKEGNEWKNVGNDRTNTMEEARQKYENSLNMPLP